MDRIPILKMGDFLLVTIQVDLYDRLAENLEADFMGRILGNISIMSKIMDAETVVVGMQPAVAITLVELGLPLKGIHCALNVEKGLELLRSKIGFDNQDDNDEDDSDLE